MSVYRLLKCKHKELVENSLKISNKSLSLLYKLMEQKGVQEQEGYTTAGHLSILINFNIFNMFITLNYSYKDKKYSYIIPIQKVNTNNKGYKLYYTCPKCLKRVGKLYKAPSKEYFMCRKCSNLIYYAQKVHNKTMDKYKSFEYECKIEELYEKGAHETKEGRRKIKNLERKKDKWLRRNCLNI